MDFLLIKYFTIFGLFPAGKVNIMKISKLSRDTHSSDLSSCCVSPDCPCLQMTEEMLMFLMPTGNEYYAVNDWLTTYVGLYLIAMIADINYDLSILLLSSEDDGLMDVTLLEVHNNNSIFLSKPGNE